MLGWKECTSWESGLYMTIEWYKSHGNGEFWENGSVEAALDAHPHQQPAAYATLK
jgi:dTDP-D-glucose 4,6-dehydratase